MVRGFKNKEQSIFWTIAFAMVFSFLLLIQLTITMKLKPIPIFLDDASYEPSIVFKILEIEENSKYYLLEGYAFDPQNRVQYENYVSGPGESHQINSSIFIKDENQALVFYTSPISIQGIFDEEGRSVHYAGFHAKIVKNDIPQDWDGIIGVFIENEGNLSYTSQTLELNYE